MPLLTLAGEGFDSDGLSVGGRLVQLGADGTWYERLTSTYGFWGLRDGRDTSDNPVMFVIEPEEHSGAGGTHNEPNRGLLYRSTDGGENWSLAMTGITGHVINAEIGPDGNCWAIADNNRIQTLSFFCDDGGCGGVNTGGPSRLYKSTDGGANWTLNFTIPDSQYGAPNDRWYPGVRVAIDPNDVNTMLLLATEQVSWRVRMYRSTDAGASWSAVIIPTFPAVTYDVSLYSKFWAISAVDASVIFGTMNIANNTFSFYRSTDDGDNFSEYFNQGSISNNYGLRGFEAAGDFWLLTPYFIWQIPDWSGDNEVEIADSDAPDSPFDVADLFTGMDDISGDLVMGLYNSVPGAGGTTDPSIYSRPDDLSTGWATHASWPTMDSDLAYRTYPWVQGVLGATPPGVEYPPVPPVAGPGLPAQEYGQTHGYYVPSRTRRMLTPMVLDLRRRRGRAR